jgi:hypothetical protein
MAKRQTDTKIWTTQRWFKKLHPFHKLAWKYITDVCDHAGIWKIDFGQLIEDTGIEDFDLSQFIFCCNQDFDKENGAKISRERIKLVNKGILWITGFVRFQYENKEFTINPKVPAIKSALTLLKGYGILSEALDKGYITLSEPIERTIDIDRDRDKSIREEVGSKEDEKGGMGEGEGEKREEEGRGGNADAFLLIPQMQVLWTTQFPTYTANRELDYPALQSIANFIFKTAGISNGFGNSDNEIKVLNTFQLIADQVNRENFWVNKPLSSISKNIQEFYNKIKNPIDAKPYKSNFDAKPTAEGVKHKLTQFAPKGG